LAPLVRVLPPLLIESLPVGGQLGLAGVHFPRPAFQYLLSLLVFVAPLVFELGDFPPGIADLFDEGVGSAVSQASGQFQPRGQLLWVGRILVFCGLGGLRR
jgi:hypothetical protein